MSSHTLAWQNINFTANLSTELILLLCSIFPERTASNYGKYPPANTSYTVVTRPYLPNPNDLTKKRRR